LSTIKNTRLALGVGLDRHELLDELVEGLDPVLGRAAVEEPGTADIPGGQVAERSLALVLVLDLLAAAGRGGQRLVLAGSGLDRGLLVGADHEVAGLEQPPLPAALIEVEDPACLAGEVGVAGKDPRAVAPRADRVLREPAPDGGARDLGDDPALDRLAGELSARPA
jgi:hypothetical protein